MAESRVILPPDSTGKGLRTSQQNIGGNNVETQYVRIEPQGGPDAVQFLGTVSNRAINEWISLMSFAVPTGYIAQPLAFRALSATAGYGARAIYARKLGSYNLGTNAYTDTGAAASAGSYFAGLFLAVTTALSAVATNLTVTYTSAHDGSSRTTGNIALAASQPIGSRLEPASLVNRTDPFGVSRSDAGLRDVTGVAENPATAATGVVDVYGYDYISYFRLPTANASVNEVFDPHLYALPAGDILSVESNSYATAVAAIAQERILTYQLTPL